MGVPPLLAIELRLLIVIPDVLPALSSSKAAAPVAWVFDCAL